MNKKWLKTVKKAEKEWKKDKQAALLPFSLENYIQATSKYNQTMRQATFEALTKAKEK